MAYVDFHTQFQQSAGRPLLQLDDLFSRTELSTIRLGMQDPVASLSKPGAISLRLMTAFGIHVTTTLADPRLEALRRLVVSLLHHPLERSCDEIEAAMAAGISVAQANMLVDLFERKTSRKSLART